MVEIAVLIPDIQVHCGNPSGGRLTSALTILAPVLTGVLGAGSAFLAAWLTNRNSRAVQDKNNQAARELQAQKLREEDRVKLRDERVKRGEELYELFFAWFQDEERSVNRGLDLWRSGGKTVEDLRNLTKKVIEEGTPRSHRIRLLMNVYFPELKSVDDEVNAACRVLESSLSWLFVGSSTQNPDSISKDLKKVEQKTVQFLEKLSASIRILHADLTPATPTLPSHRAQTS